tara:strand:+ start:33761 stop:34006 length:246 start_codon:yes stop_codon:yes gene_type:complete
MSTGNIPACLIQAAALILMQKSKKPRSNRKRGSAANQIFQPYLGSENLNREFLGKALPLRVPAQRRPVPCFRPNYASEKTN